MSDLSDPGTSPVRRRVVGLRARVLDVSLDALQRAGALSTWVARRLHDYRHLSGTRSPQTFAEVVLSVIDAAAAGVHRLWNDWEAAARGRRDHSVACCSFT
jgi:hypothetical protein